jgi:hypothetical protein
MIWTVPDFFLARFKRTDPTVSIPGQFNRLSGYKILWTYCLPPAWTEAEEKIKRR